MWLYMPIVMTFTVAYFFFGIVPIVYAAWYGLWLVFWLSIAAWIGNCVLLWLVNRILDNE